MKRYIIADPHFFHYRIGVYCGRPDNFTDKIITNWRNTVTDKDIVYVLGDVILHADFKLKDIMDNLPGRKFMVRGNHDKKSDTWYLNNGFDAISDAMMVGDILLTHKPQKDLSTWVKYNVHGHLHNLKLDDVGFGEVYDYLTKKHILYAPELRDYRPVDIQKLIADHERKIRVANF
jgi:calcineurin-like phosphoesterase family protein